MEGGAAVDICAANDTGDGWWDAAVEVDIATAASGAACESFSDGDEDDDGWFDTTVEQAFFELGARSAPEILAVFATD